MPKINDRTTLAEIAILRAQYGVRWLTFDYLHDPVAGPICKVTLLTLDHVVIGTSTPRGILKMLPETEALDDAFDRLKHLQGAALNMEGAINGTSNGWAL